VKILNTSEVKNVSGGFDTVSTLCFLTVTNLALGFYNTSQIKKLNNLTAETDDILHHVSSLSFYQEAQLSLLPEYTKVRSLSLNAAINLVPV
jgi:hypothetical protein